MIIWTNFKAWMRKSWMEHPIYTVIFGVACAVVGGIIF